MNKWLSGVLVDPLEFAIYSFHLAVLGLCDIEIIQIKMSGLTQKLPQLELVIDDQANVAYILFTEMASRLVISTVFLCHERIWVSLERIIVVITFRATLNWFLLFFAMIGDFLLFLVVFDLRTKHVIHNVRDISIFIEMHSILGGLKLLITLNFYIQNSLRSVARNR